MKGRLSCEPLHFAPLDCTPLFFCQIVEKIALKLESLTEISLVFLYVSKYIIEQNKPLGLGHWVDKSLDHLLQSNDRAK